MSAIPRDDTSSAEQAPAASGWANDSADTMERLLRDITALESLVASWDDSHKLTLTALKSAIESLHKEALRRLVRTLKEDPACMVKLRESMQDQVVFGVMRYHGLIKDPLQIRIEAALDEVRPFMREHGGDVELVAVKPPDTVEIRLVGSCHGCPASGQTLAEGVEKAIRAHCPEIVHIRQVSKGLPEARGEESVVRFISPFAQHVKAGWLDAGTLDEIPEGSIREITLKNRSLLLSRRGEEVSCVDNRCAHLGMPLEMGDVRDGVITCSFHGFQFLLETGECLTAPEVQLKVHAVRVTGRQVQVRLEE